ncbi:anhydro-N-acetylmuramic acid kinase [Microbacterium hydrocarbonoxydans]|uniref:anhydro-N-acetylmuramic acid kinase n=1 Tax=Microbacterium hydrocarbonoxydans TaxID=273678 RepID=UPI0007BB308B|nr:anhydro-N-acetylmuramic acid kinase [Microbacterium hydrocarbonoxydans]GAT71661.1 anhydro-N-acetylmuramic acid kinase [Microbacterium sp. HM58-2]
MRVLGLLSGTSHDGIDVTVVDFTESDGAVHGTVLHEDSIPYDPALRARLVAALPPAQTTFAEVCELDTLIGQAFAEVAANAAAAVGGVDAVCSHGQTVFHWVDGEQARGTLQIGQPAWIAERTGAPVVSDVRIRDIAAGGHGAPLVSFLDELLLRGRAGVSAAVNLGGIANITVVGPDGLSAYDIGPANALVDAVVVAEGLNERGYDADAAIARTGAVDEDLLAALLADPYYALPAPKSTGKEHFHLDYVRAHTAGRDLAVADLVRTLTELTVRTVAQDVRAAGIGFLAASGGGCHNPLIMEGLRAALPGVEVVLADELGAPADSKEAILFALIGWCTLHGVPAVIPGGTGAQEPRILGTITPGAGPLRLPEPVAALRSLTLG